MHARFVLPGLCVVSLSVVGGLAASMATESEVAVSQPVGELALQQLQSDFHLANTTGDFELMLSLWAEDAVFSNPAMVVTGREAIANFFASGPYWGQVANLAPTYRAEYEIHGHVATYKFECILVDVSGGDPLMTPLSTIPFGAQNPVVEIVQHSTAQGIMIIEGGRWVFKTFNGSAGPN